MRRQMPRNYWSEDLGMEVQDQPSLTVYDDEGGPIDTGLLDHRGEAILRHRPRIGYLPERHRIRVKALSRRV